MTGRRFLFVSRDGLIGDVAWRVKRLGNEVKYAITVDEFSQDVCEGIVPRVDDWEAHIGWADVVVFDDSFGLGTHAERLRAEGVPVIGGTALTDRLETDRAFGQSTMERLGLDVIESAMFSDLTAGIRHVQDQAEPFVIKPSGEDQNYNELLYVGQEADGTDVVDMLRRYRDRWDEPIESFQLQRRIEGVEVSICGFFDGERFLEPINYTFEHKRLYPGDLGPMTGEMGTSMFWDPPNELYRATLARFEDLLREEGYVGPFDVNCIANDSGVHPLEPTPRFGYPQIMIQAEALHTPLDAFLYDLATGGEPALDVHDGYQVGLRVCVPPFPADDVHWFEEHTRDLIVRFPGDGGVPPGFHLEDIKHTDGQYRVAGETGEVLVTVGTGETMAQARRRAVDRAASVVLPNKFYRRDVGERWDVDAERLQRWGYLREGQVTRQVP